ncbi:transposase [Streptomyces sp. NPDC001781]
MGTEATPGCFWRGLRLLAVDGTCWDVADSPANEAAFGRPRNGRGHDKPSLPQVRMACLIEVGTHLVLDAEPAGCRTGEVTLASRLSRSCQSGELVLADREFLGVRLWRAFTDSSADLLWRVPANRILPVERQFLWPPNRVAGALAALGGGPQPSQHRGEFALYLILMSAVPLLAATRWNRWPPNLRSRFLPTFMLTPCEPSVTELSLTSLTLS